MTATARIDEQEAMDLEDAVLFRRAVRKLADKVRKHQAEEGRRRDALKKARKEVRFADNRLSAISEAKDESPPGDLT